MGAENGHQESEPEQLAVYPQVGLDWAYDDRDNPSKLTIFDPAEPRIATSWITVDTGTSRCLEQTR